MNSDHIDHNLAARWARVGVNLNVRPLPRTPDLERLLLDTARACPNDPRLFVLAVSWLTRFSIYVAVHRLKQLALDELSPKDQATLGLLIETAVEHGAPAHLARIVTAKLATDPTPEPLFESDRGPLRALIEASATPVSRHWGRWVQPIELKLNALRDPQWVVSRNKTFTLRAAHKGDLRCSIIESLNRDLKRGPASETTLARRCGATIPAVRTAIHDLCTELPNLRIERRRGRGGSRVTLRTYKAGPSARTEK